MAYTPKPEAAARRAELDHLVAAGCAAMHQGLQPTEAQAEAIRNAYRTARRASREGVRSANTARQMALMCKIEDARAAYPKAATARLQAAQPGAATPPTAAATAQALDPFTGQPMAPVATPQNFVL